LYECHVALCPMITVATWPIHKYCRNLASWVTRANNLRQRCSSKHNNKNGTVFCYVQEYRPPWPPVLFIVCTYLPLPVILFCFLRWSSSLPIKFYLSVQTIIHVYWHKTVFCYLDGQYIDNKTLSIGIYNASAVALSRSGAAYFPFSKRSSVVQEGNIQLNQCHSHTWDMWHCWFNECHVSAINCGTLGPLFYTKSGSGSQISLVHDLSYPSYTPRSVCTVFLPPTQLRSLFKKHMKLHLLSSYS